MECALFSCFFHLIYLPKSRGQPRKKTIGLRKASEKMRSVIGHKMPFSNRHEGTLRDNSL